ncbi:rCG50422, isoform CRA_c [Rattus norvegicus]|nr:rCG50422, isoform CRA_c [Rattus norvegicus]
MGLGAVPGRQAAFREGLEQAVLYAKALGCPRIHLMAGRVPRGADREAVKGEMETVFVENLRHAAEVLAQENLVGLLEPINTRITDPQYFLDTPQQAAAILQKVGRPNLQLQMDIFHWQVMAWESDWKHQGVPAHRWACASGTGPRPRGARQLWRAGLYLPVPAARR